MGKNRNNSSTKRVTNLTQHHVEANVHKIDSKQPKTCDGVKTRSKRGATPLLSSLEQPLPKQRKRSAKATVTKETQNELMQSVISEQPSTSGHGKIAL